MSEQKELEEKLIALEGQLIVGIDLGTTNSGISVWNTKQGQVTMFTDDAGHSLTPSMVGWDHAHNTWIVGRAAKELGVQRPGEIAYSIKRYIGRWFRDPNVRDGRQDLTYKLVSGGGADQLRDVVVDFGADDSGQPVRLTAPEISGKILFKLRQDAANALQIPLEELKYAVITVPAYFDVLQRKATVLAGAEAGLEVVDILNEPTAAALAYGDAILGPEERRILVYDLGGGTFDISLLEVSQDEEGYLFYTRVIDGDTRLGGDDIDISVARWLASEIEKRYGHPVRPDDQITMERLRRAAEEAKITLTNADTIMVNLPNLDLGSRTRFDAEIELTREQLETCAANVLKRTRAIAKRAVEDVASLTWDEIDEIILVGGQTLMPAIQRQIKDLWGHKPRVNDKPELAVALGAGEYAHILSLGQEKFHQNALINVIALPMGIRLDDNTFKPLVEANATLPHVSKPYPVTTTEDNQTSISVDVLQGPRGAIRADECVVLGNLLMEVPPAPARTPKFEVVFDVLRDGTMQVRVEDVRRKRSKTLDIVETKQSIVWRDKPQEEEE